MPAYLLLAHRSNPGEQPNDENSHLIYLYHPPKKILYLNF